MKKFHPILLALGCFTGFAMGQTEELKDYVFPLPDRFAEFADQTLSGRGQTLRDVIRLYGPYLGKGTKIEINRAAGSLEVRLPRNDALRVIELLNLCLTQSTARFFRPCYFATEERDGVRAGLPIPTPYAGREVAIHVVDRDMDRITFLLVNPTDHPIWTAPDHRIQYLKDGAWTDYKSDLGYCGTCRPSTGELPGQRASHRFEVPMPDVDGLPLRLGIRLLDDLSIQRLDDMVWSGSIRMR